MSEPPYATGDPGYAAEFAGDQTQPTEEILNALNSASNNNSSNSLSSSGTGSASSVGFSNNPRNSPVKSETPPNVPPPSEFDILKAQLAENPHNPDGWRRLLELAESSGDIEKIRMAFDALLQQYPNTSSAQIAYINHFLNNQDTFGEAEELFKKFLKTSPSVDLWRFYLIYVRRVNTGPATRDTVRKSYEFALSHIGQDKDSGEIWRDYVQFLRAGEASTTWEEQQKMDALRKVYHRAVQIPLNNVEELWQELETFETNLNRITAKKFMADLSPAHMQARTVLRQLTNHLNGLYPSMPSPFASGAVGAVAPADIYLPPPPTFNAAERTLVGKWKAYLKWEENNPLEIDERERATLISRIQGVYRKAVIRMKYYTEIWFMAYTWTASIGRHDEAFSILGAGLEANPSSFLLNFAYAEALEVKKEFEEVHATFDKFLGVLRKDLEALEQREKSANSSSTSIGAGATNAPPGSGQSSSFNMNGNGGPATSNGGASSEAITIGGIQSGNASFNTQVSDEKPPQSSELSERRRDYGLVYIVYMRFGRRAGGVKSSRAIFGKARKDKWTPWEVYEASALMEYHCSNDQNVASRIFEKGLETFGDEVEYVLRYLGFLISINDENNARALFERVIPTFPPDRARLLWERWARYEYQYGDLEAGQKLEKRIAEVYPSDPAIKRFAQRHTYLSIDAIAARDLGFAMARKTATPSMLGRSDTSQLLMASSSSGGLSSTAAAAGGSASGASAGPTGGGPSIPHKRPPSPEYGGGGGGGAIGRKRGDDRGGPSEYGPGHKRQRPMSPLPRGERGERGDRWEGPGPRRRFSPGAPGWEREDRGPRYRDDDKARAPTLPSVLTWFIGELPPPSAFDGPVFRTDDLMNLFRNAVIPSSGRSRSPPPPPPPAPRSGRPPPDYGPYQGPGGGRPGRRY